MTTRRRLVRSVAFQSGWTGGDNGILGVWPGTWLGSKRPIAIWTGSVDGLEYVSCALKFG